jgi:hypothetical protein
MLGHELGIGLGNTTACTYTINVCMWGSAVSKDRKSFRKKKSLKSSVYGKGNILGYKVRTRIREYN